MRFRPLTRRTLLGRLLGTGATISAAHLLAREPAISELRRVEDQDGWHVWVTSDDQFRIETDFPADQMTLARLAKVVGGTIAAVRSHPLGLGPLTNEPAPCLRVFKEKVDFEAAGATKDSAGTYLMAARAVLLRGDLLAARHGGRGDDARNLNDALIVHELTHACMHRFLAPLPLWITEGIADYFAALHQGDGTFLAANDAVTVATAIKDYLRRRLNPDDPEILASPLREITPLDGKAWNRYALSLPATNRQQPYVSALLLVHFHLHGGSVRYEKMNSWLANASNLNAASNRERRGPIGPLKVTVELGDLAETEIMLTKFWHPRGIRLRFMPAETLAE